MTPRIAAALLVFLGLGLDLGTVAAHAADAQADVHVEVFSPTGTVKHVRQVRVRFSAPMVALGDPRLPAPFNIDCAAAGHGRWADERDWVYDFDADLDGAVRCTFRLRPGLHAVNGAHVAGPARFSFDTGGPAVMSSLPRDGWQEIDQDQIFLLRLDAAATPESIQAHAYCAIDGVVERIPVDVLTGSARAAVLAQRKLIGYDYLQLLWKNGAVSDLRARNRSMERREALITVLRCRRRLPPATKVMLVWGAGIAGTSGIATATAQRLAFEVRPAFTAAVNCTRTNPRVGCMPVAPVVVNFSAPVPRRFAAEVRLTDATGQRYRPTLAAGAADATFDELDFPGPFPASVPLTVELPPGLVDDAGRPLANAARFPLRVAIDAYPPLVKFSGSFGILEAREGGVLPVTVRRVEPVLAAQRLQVGARLQRVGDDPRAITHWLRRVKHADDDNGEWVDLPPAADGKPQRIWRNTTGSQSIFGAGDHTTAFRLPTPLGGGAEQVVGIALGRPGFYVVELQSRLLGAALLGRDVPRYVATAALVTDLAVHFEWGRESSLVWVTRLHDAKPVADAAVTVSDACSGALLWQGRTGSDGVASIAKTFGDPTSQYAGCPYQHPLIAVARRGGDFSFTESTWSGGIAPEDFSLPTGADSTADIADTVLDRTLFRAGETVSMKHFLRRHVQTGLAIPPTAAGAHRIVIRHEGGGRSYTLSATFDRDGIATTQWTIPPEAKLGDYTVSIDDTQTATFKVGDFRLPSMHASVTGPPLPVVSPRPVNLDLHVAYLSGGGAGGLAVKVRTLIEPIAQQFPGYSDYTFGGIPVTPGITTTAQGPADFDFDATEDRETTRTQTIPLTLDDAGSARLTLAHLPRVTEASRLTAELEYADANGELRTAAGTVRLVPATLNLGIRAEGWIASPKQLRFRVVALGLDGKPVPGQRVDVSLYQSTDYSYRKRLIGGFYAYETTTLTRKIAASCSGLTNAQGLLLCAVAPGVSGQVIVRAETHDAADDLAGATTSMWVVDADSWWFGGTQGDRMDVLPEKKHYEAGETARLQVRMPFRAATALVTVEREGILRRFVTTLHGRAPIIDVPIEPQDAPNVFISVLAVRGRIAGPHSAAPSALVDLAKPTYRLGLAQVQVGWRPHRLDVRVAPDRSVYKVRDLAHVQIHVAAADGRALPAGAEVAVAAVDQALLDLAPNGTWKLLEAMMGERGLEVRTSTAQMQVVGNRHYGRKAVPHGGGGGRALARARELFNTLLVWKPRVVLDKGGNANVTVPLNDSLTAFRIVAIANAGADRFGTGSATIHTTQDLILESGLPPLVRAGDRYDATFTIRNTTDRALHVRLAGTSAALAGGRIETRLDVPAGGARDVSWPATAPQRGAPLAWNVAASADGTSATDRLAVAESVIPAVPVRTYAATIERVDAPRSIPIELPRGALPGRGGLEVALEASLGTRLDGVRAYMTRYPYTCLEQQASRAIALDSRSQWDALMKRLPAYMDRDGLLKYFASDSLQGDDSLTAYLLSIASARGWPLLGADRKRLLGALTSFVDGRLVRDSALQTADLSVRKLQAIAALSRYGAARADMLDSLRIDPNLLPTSALLDWIAILEHTPGIDGADAKITQAFGLLRARLTFQGTTLGFSTERTDALWWLMISADSNANRLLLAVLDRPDWRADVPRLVQGALGRQHFGHWNTTVANAWGVIALRRFAATFESTPVSGQTSVDYGATTRVTQWPQAAGLARIELPWQSGPGTLRITHSGGGTPWALVRATAALPLTEPLSTGFKITRRVTAVERQHPGVWTRGDVMRVHLDLESESDMSWVVVDDPIPAGATILGGGLGGESSLLQRGARNRGWAWPAFTERRFDGYRAYYRFVPKGHWSVEYTVRLNDAGTFQLPPTRIEAMYAPEMLGELPNADVAIRAADPAP